MSGVKPDVKPVKLICGVLYQETADLKRLNDQLASRWGPIDLKSDPFFFNFTDYYAGEMGEDLVKQFYAFENLILPDSLADIKNTTILIEKELSFEGPRTVNIDPGYLEESKLVLASTKNFSHRIYLKNGIWAEVTLRYEKGDFVVHPWTYPDYAQPLAIEFLKTVREKYRTQLHDLP